MSSAATPSGNLARRALPVALVKVAQPYAAEIAVGSSIHSYQQAVRL
jgi:hypothetical protein